MTRSRRQGRTVFFVEDEEFDFDDGAMYLATFSGHVETRTSMGAQVEGLTAEEAVRWGRERADVVLIRLADGDEYLSAGTDHPPDTPRWPPPEPVVRRRAAGQRWRDRTETDAPIAWAVDLVLSVPPDTPVGERAAAVGARARRGMPPLSAFAETVRVVVAEGRRPGEEGLPTVPHRIELDVDAPTAEIAARRAAERFAAPSGWGVQAWVRPLEQRPARVVAERWHVATALWMPAPFAERLAEELRALLHDDPRFTDVEVRARGGACDVEAVVTAPDDSEATVAADDALDDAFARSLAHHDEDVGWTQQAWSISPAAPEPP